MAITLTPGRQRLIINGLADLMYIVSKLRIPLSPQQSERVKAAWDAVKEPGMESISFGSPQKKSPIIMPFGESAKFNPISQVEQFATAADLKRQ